ncbi:MAG: SUF system NifU family Fe-S cluster assembly protein [Gammaproteobacteria bacterium]|nr:SUF system NifU family Fe-S cluster assembly protein [Gammaproteobacteria bacterium]
MNSAEDLKALYRDTVLEHSRNPRHCGRLESATHSAIGHNPLCGDKVTVHLKIDGDRIEDIAFEGTGCAISLASASIMTETEIHHTVDEAKQETDKILQQFSSTQDNAPAIEGEMAALGSVRQYPSRIKCATLAWKTLEAALSDDAQQVTTEK